MVVRKKYTTSQTMAEGKRVGLISTTTMTPAGEILTGLQGYRFLNLTTFRKYGAPVVTTVLFALAHDTIFVWTTSDSGKAKRIRNNATVQIAPSTRLGRPRGPRAAASARILAASEQAAAKAITDRQFGWLKQLFGLIWRLQGREQIYIAITPAKE